MSSYSRPEGNGTCISTDLSSSVGDALAGRDQSCGYEPLPGAPVTLVWWTSPTFPILREKCSRYGLLIYIFCMAEATLCKRIIIFICLLNYDHALAQPITLRPFWQRYSQNYRAPLYQGVLASRFNENQATGHTINNYHQQVLIK